MPVSYLAELHGITKVKSTSRRQLLKSMVIAALAVEVGATSPNWTGKPDGGVTTGLQGRPATWNNENPSICVPSALAELGLVALIVQTRAFNGPDRLTTANDRPNPGSCVGPG